MNEDPSRRSTDRVWVSFGTDRDTPSEGPPRDETPSSSGSVDPQVGTIFHPPCVTDVYHHVKCLLVLYLSYTFLVVSLVFCVPLTLCPSCLGINFVCELNVCNFCTSVYSILDRSSWVCIHSYILFYRPRTLSFLLLSPTTSFFCYVCFYR